MRYDTNLNPDESKRPSTRANGQVQLSLKGSICSQARTTQVPVAQGQTVNP